jgi:hypothetical protein
MGTHILGKGSPRLKDKNNIDRSNRTLGSRVEHMLQNKQQLMIQEKGNKFPYNHWHQTGKFELE